MEFEKDIITTSEGNLEITFIGHGSMKNLKDIDYAFLPMNLPYTMTPEMAADAAKAFNPKVLYPYHFGNTDPSNLEALMIDTPGVEVRVRKMQ